MWVREGMRSRIREKDVMNGGEGINSRWEVEEMSGRIKGRSVKEGVGGDIQYKRGSY